MVGEGAAREDYNVVRGYGVKAWDSALPELGPAICGCGCPCRHTYQWPCFSWRTLLHIPIVQTTTSTRTDNVTTNSHAIRRSVDRFDGLPQPSGSYYLQLTPDIYARSSPTSARQHGRKPSRAGRKSSTTTVAPLKYFLALRQPPAGKLLEDIHAVPTSCVLFMSTEHTPVDAF